MGSRYFLKNRSQTIVWLLLDQGHPNPFIFNCNQILIQMYK